MALFMRKASCITRLFASARARCCAAGSSIVVLWQTKKHLTPAIPAPHHHLNALRVDQPTRTTLQRAALPCSTASTPLCVYGVPTPHLQECSSPGKKRPRNSLQVTNRLQHSSSREQRGTVKHQIKEARRNSVQAAFTP